MKIKSMAIEITLAGDKAEMHEVERRIHVLLNSLLDSKTEFDYTYRVRE
jgi:hypothetical protein